MLILIFKKWGREVSFGSVGKHRYDGLAFAELFGKEGHLDAIHAGLECGIITSGIAKAQNKEIAAIAIGEDDGIDVYSPVVAKIWHKGELKDLSDFRTPPTE